MGKKLTYRIHSLRRMFERNISDSDVRHVLEYGEIIETYPDDTPYPSHLVLGWRESRPIHIVVADLTDSDEAIIITTYEPDHRRWQTGFKERIQS